MAVGGWDAQAALVLSALADLKQGQKDVVQELKHIETRLVDKLNDGVRDANARMGKMEVDVAVLKTKIYAMSALIAFVAGLIPFALEKLTGR